MSVKDRKPDTAAHLIRRNGAWLIVLSEISVNQGAAVPDDLFDCAASVIRAKQVAIEMARQLGWTGRVLWKHEPMYWTLTMTDPGYEVDDDDDE